MASSVFDTNANGGRYHDLSPSTVGGQIGYQAPSGVRGSAITTHLAYLNKNDLVYLRVYQTSGGNLNLMSGVASNTMIQLALL